MSERSTIEWTDATWNPVRGCTKVSPGCTHCYAETFAERFRDVKGHPYEHGFDLRLVPRKLAEPFRWTGRKTVFVNSMSDLFHEAVPEPYVTAVGRVMAAASWHTYQVLTKRAARLQELLSGPLGFAAELPHVWWGVSVENRRHGLPRVVSLQNTPARVRFLSIEPLLEDLGKIPLDGIHWVIVGGESGARARPMQEAWVRSILEQCRAGRVPFFFKQWGGFSKGRNGRKLGGRTYDELPGLVERPIPALRERRAALDAIELLASQFSDQPLPLREHLPSGEDAEAKTS